MATPIKLGALLRKQPEDIIAAFEAKGLKVTGDWHEMWQEAHARAFTVAHVARADILMEIHAELLRATSQGVSGREFVRRLKPRMKALGWWGEAIEADEAGQARRIRLGSPYRLRFIYRQNMQSSYMAGRWKSQKENADARPWWQYVSVLDSKTRPGHRALHGRVFRHDDPFWESFYPPNGWNCRCRVRALSDRRLRAKGLSPESSRGKIGRETRDISVNKRTGEVTQGEISTFSYTGPDFRRRVFRPDPGWSYNPGSATYGADIEMLRKLTAIEHVGIRAQAIQAINNSEVRHALFASWVDQVLGRRVTSTVQVAGIMDDDVVDFVRRHGREPARIIAISHYNLNHANMPKHESDSITRLTPGEYKLLPAMIARPDAVYWDNKNRNLVYIKDAGNGWLIYLPVSTQRKARSARKLGRMDVMVNAYKIRPERLRNEGRYEKKP